jgi:SAM-dependent methyltransferase
MRETFDTAAELYDTARPRYTAELFADLARHTGLRPGFRALEIGVGTGQATTGLLDLGADVLGIELGPALASHARDLLGERAEIVNGDFDNWEPEAGAFDLVLTATSWHWLDRATRTEKAARALVSGSAPQAPLRTTRPGGWLATIGTGHVKGGTVPFFVEVQDCYERWVPATPPNLRQQEGREIPDLVDEVDESELFDRPAHYRYEVDIPYTTVEYLNLLRTYSDHIALPAEARNGLFECISGLIDGKYGGAISKRYLFQLRLAQRR